MSIGIRGLVVATVIALAVLPAARARADEASEREEARKEFGAGQAADRQKDWQLAIEHYLRANDLVPHPNAMFNIATNYERLGKLREAAVWYQRYVEAAKDSPDRDKVIRTLRDLAAKPGTLTVRSIPNGARVLVDNTFVGVTPYSGHIRGGSHRVIIEHENQREEREAKIEFGEPAILDVTLRGASGTLRVEGEPVGALVTVDRMPAGSVPLTLGLAPGVHTVRVTQYGFAPYDTTAAINANQETVIDARLSRALGTIDGGRPKIQIGYLFGFGGGADLRGNGNSTLFLAELGARAGQYDASLRLGKIVGFTAIDLMVRWAITKGKISPFVGVGYTFIGNNDTGGSAASSGGGYTLSGGLRFDISRGDRYGLSIIAESGLRYYSGLDISEAGDAPTTESGLIVPIMTSVQVVYR